MIRSLLSMRPRGILMVVVGLVLAAPSLADEDDFQPGRVAVFMVPGQPIDPILTDYALTLDTAIPGRDLYLLIVPEGEEEGFADLLVDDPRVDETELNFLARDPGPGTQSFYLSSVGSAFDTQYGLDLAGLTRAHTAATGDGVVVAVVDTGVDATHPLLIGRIAPGGIDLVVGGTDTSDRGDGQDTDGDGLVDEMLGHGTFVSGLIAAGAPGSRILPIRALDADGVTTSFRVAAGVDHAVRSGARVINLSLGSVGDNDLLSDAVEWAADAGVVVVAAAGNEGTDSPRWAPSSVPMAIAVAATNQADVKPPFSNFGEHIDLTAPGVSVVSAVPLAVSSTGYGQADGTSYAAPLVSAAAALVLEVEPTLAAVEVEARLRGSAASVESRNPAHAGLLGSGRLNAALAVGLCSVDLDGDAALTIFDFLVFQNLFDDASPIADFDRDGVLTIFDFLAFQNLFDLGCG